MGDLLRLNILLYIKDKENILLYFFKNIKLILNMKVFYKYNLK